VRAAAILGVLVCLALVTSAPDRAALSGTPMLTGCVGKSLIRPEAIDFCGDGVFFLRRIRWASWGRSSAVAAGMAHQDDCRPDCARGHYRLYPVAVWLTRVRTCSDYRVQYTRLVYEFLVHHPAGIKSGPLVVTAPLGAGAACCP
jgi:hypothetical protein